MTLTSLAKTPRGAVSVARGVRHPGRRADFEPARQPQGRARVPGGRAPGGGPHHREAPGRPFGLRGRLMFCGLRSAPRKSINTCFESCRYTHWRPASHPNEQPQGQLKMRTKALRFLTTLAPDPVPGRFGPWPRTRLPRLRRPRRRPRRPRRPHRSTSSRPWSMGWPTTRPWFRPGPSSWAANTTPIPPWPTFCPRPRASYGVTSYDRAQQTGGVKSSDQTLWAARN